MFAPLILLPFQSQNFFSNIHLYSWTTKRKLENSSDPRSKFSLHSYSPVIVQRLALLMWLLSLVSDSCVQYMIVPSILTLNLTHQQNENLLSNMNVRWENVLDVKYISSFQFIVLLRATTLRNNSNLLSIHINNLRRFPFQCISFVVV